MGLGKRGRNWMITWARNPTDWKSWAIPGVVPGAAEYQAKAGAGSFDLGQTNFGNWGEGAKDYSRPGIQPWSQMMVPSPGIDQSPSQQQALNQIFATSPAMGGVSESDATKGK